MRDRQFLSRGQVLLGAFVWHLVAYGLRLDRLCLKLDACAIVKEIGRPRSDLEFPVLPKTR
jgi:hypothetical protein